MRTPFATLATASSLGLSIVFASFTPALATQAATKPADVITVGTTARPDAQPADPHPPMATRASGFHRAAATPAQSTNAKPQDTSTSLAADAVGLSAAQRAKIAQRPEPLAPPASTTSGSAKSGNFSTAEPPTPNAMSLSPDALAQIKLATAPVAQPTEATYGRGAASVLGIIPRPEWSTGISSAKPADISTIAPPAPGASRATMTSPSAAELQRRAAPTSASHEPKARETSTTLPRDPALPPASTTKPSSQSSPTQEVQK